jgi:aminoglycoside phosphotransferase (APT) family kinase protein
VGELVRGGGSAGFVEVDELVGGQAEHLPEVGAVAPRGEQVADAGEGVPPLLEPADQLQAAEVGAPIDADPTAAFRRGEQPERLVLADGAHGHLGPAAEVVDGQRDLVVGIRAPGGGHGWTVTPFTVTVNNVTDLNTALLEVLRAETETPTLAYDGTPRRLSGGFWAELVAFRLCDAPEGWTGELVARVMPDPVIAGKESAFQAEVAAQGFPTPAVHLVGGPDDGLGRSFLVMDLARGGPLLDGLDGAGAIAALPRLARRLPVVLGEAMAALHRLDATPVRARLEDLADVAAFDLADFLARLREGATLLGREDLASAARWLEDNPPPPAPVVICHGDLHPFNLLVDLAGEVTVLDWSAGLLAPGAYDVAFTSLLLSEPPLAVPRPLAWATRGAGRLLARRFLRTYSREHGADLDPRSLRWHEGVVCLRSLEEVAGWVAAGELEAHRGHPWLISGPAFADRLTALTGTRIAAR